MTGTHPDELDLLSYVEDDLGRGERDTVASHLATCPDCGARVRDLEHARDVLRAAPTLEFPADRLSVELPRRAEERRVYVSPMRLATILAPVAAVVALIVGIANLPRGGDDEGGGAGGEAAQAERDAGAGAGEAEEELATTLESPGEQDAAPLAGAVVARVQGPPQRVVRLLRREGYNVVVVERTVVVRNAKVAEVRQTLAGQPRGAVDVTVD